MKVNAIQLVLYAMTIGIVGCNKPENVSFNSPGNASYSITEVHPASAIPGTKITIYGTKFPQKDLEVYFDDVLVDSLESLSALSVTVKVPRVKDAGKVKLEIRTRKTDLHSNGLPFTVGPILNDLPPVYFTTHKLYRGQISERGLLQIDELADIGFPRGLFIDHSTNEIVYASYYGQVYRKKEGSDPILVKKFPEGLECMVLDKKKEWMYLSDGSKVSRMSMSDTSRIEVLYTGRQRPKSLHINEQTNQLLWVESDPLYIMAGALDGKTPAKEIFTMETGLTGPTCIEIDQVNQKLYVGDVPSFGNSRILVGDLKKPGQLEILLRSVDGIGENIQHLEYDKTKYLYAMNSKGINTNINEDGGIVRIPLQDKDKKPEVILQPINHGLLIAL